MKRGETQAIKNSTERQQQGRYHIIILFLANTCALAFWLDYCNFFTLPSMQTILQAFSRDYSRIPSGPELNVVHCRHWPEVEDGFSQQDAL